MQYAKQYPSGGTGTKLSVGTDCPTPEEEAGIEAVLTTGDEAAGAAGITEDLLRNRLPGAMHGVIDCIFLIA